MTSTRWAPARTDASTTLALRAGDYRAVVSPVGAALVDLRHGGRALVQSHDTVPPQPRFRGAVLAPWPNRIRDGRYTYGGQQHQLAITEPDRGCALHGLLLWHEWTVEHRTANELVLSTTVAPQPGYPFRVEVTACYVLDAVRGLRTIIGAGNLGDRPAPFGASMHPYLRAGAGPVDDWTLRLPARTVLDVDERLLPTRRRPVAGTEFDFRAARRVRGTRLDHAFGDVRFDDDGLAAAVLTAADGRGVLVEWDTGSPWVQVYTCDEPDPRIRRASIAIEPMTCPPDAFNSGIDLWHLAPGETRSVAWRIAHVSRQTATVRAAPLPAAPHSGRSVPPPLKV